MAGVHVERDEGEAGLLDGLGEVLELAAVHQELAQAQRDVAAAVGRPVHEVAELLRFGEDNDLISTRVHALSIALLTAGSFDALMLALREQLVHIDRVVTENRFPLLRKAGYEKAMAVTGGLNAWREAGLPVVPLATRGMWELNRKGTWLFKPANISIYVGAPIETVGLDNDQVLVVMARVQKIIRDFAEHGIVPDPALTRPVPFVDRAVREDVARMLVDVIHTYLLEFRPPLEQVAIVLRDRALWVHFREAATERGMLLV